MTRQIKFRAWDVEKKEMLKVDDLHLRGEYFTSTTKGHTTQKTFSNIELMQYTGFKDKNGVEVYEGDIIKVYDWDSEEYLHTQEVKWSNVGGYFSKYDTGEFCPPIGDYDALLIEVIGNKWKNPELLKGENATNTLSNRPE